MTAAAQLASLLLDRFEISDKPNLEEICGRLGLPSGPTSPAFAARVVTLNRCYAGTTLSLVSQDVRFD